MPPAIQPVILAGGSGSRLWPVSRHHFPKHLMALHSEASMLQETALRVQGEGFAPPMVVCNEEQRFLVARHLQEAGITPTAILLEPEGRNTAPAAALAALQALRNQPEALLLFLPADHLIQKPERFLEAIRKAGRAARAGKLVTFGIQPNQPETGYGYIQAGDPLAGLDGCQAIANFKEKPNLQTATGYLKAGHYYWNSGIFLFPAKLLLEELERLQPQMVAACRQALDGARQDMDFIRPEGKAFLRAPSISIDHALMEHTPHGAVVPVEMGWNDLGSWLALWETAPKDGEGNALVGDVMAEDTRNSYIHSPDMLTAVVGMEGVVVVTTPDAVLVVSADKAQEVKRVVERLKAAQRDEHLFHVQVHRPWGSYQGLHQDQGYKVKVITVAPGASLSLQRHRRRAEHWVVVEGKAMVVRDAESYLVEANQSTYIPLGAIHRLENPGPGPLKIVEVQTGDYLEEDDIERLEDRYNRMESAC